MNADRIGWLQTQTFVRALRLAAGDQPSVGYLSAIGGDVLAIADHQMNAMMAASLRSR